MTYQGDDRRRQQRSPLTTFCPIRFELNGKNHSGTMTNISSTGAGFKAEETGEHIKIETNQEVVFHVKTPYGDSECVGRIAWADLKDGHFHWGVEFIRLSEDSSDPLRCLIDSSF